MMTEEELALVGFKAVGLNAQISSKASIYGAKNISLGNNVRIDDFCVLGAGKEGINIGNHVHLGVGATLIGAGKITMSDFSGLSSRVSVYSSSDDYTGAALTNPTVPAEFTNVTNAPVYLGRHVIIGSGAVILPGVTVHDGAAVGALALVTKDCEEFGVYAGAPARLVSRRERHLLTVETMFLAKQ